MLFNCSFSCIKGKDLTLPQNSTKMTNFYLTEFSPLISAALYFIATKNTIHALGFGSIIGALFALNFSFVAILNFFIEEIGNASGILIKNFDIASLNISKTSINFLNNDRGYILLFVVILNIFILILSETKIIFGIQTVLERFFKGKTGVKVSALFVGFLLFIDDFLNLMTNSKLTKINCEKYKISKYQLALIPTALAAPLCSIAPVSSWLGIILSYTKSGLETAGLSETITPLTLFLGSIKYCFFQLFIVISAICLLFVKTHSDEEIETKTPEHDSSKVGTATEFFFFAMLLPVLVVALLLRSGNFGKNNFWDAIASSYAEPQILISAILCFVIASAYALLKKGSNLYQIAHWSKDAIIDTLPILQLLIASKLFAQTINACHTADALGSFATNMISQTFIFPSVFLICTVIAFFLGSCWASMSLLLPMLIPIGAIMLKGTLATSLPIFVGAILSGIICGYSLSPACDLLIMNCKSFQINYTHFLKAQFMFVLPATIVSLLAFFAIGKSNASLAYGLILGLGTFIISILLKKHHSKTESL